MATLTLYDSQGKRLESDGSREVSTRIENFFFGGVRLYMETGPETELVVFFRARESKSSRANQYYAVYRTDDTRQLFERFKDDLRRRVEDEHGMTLQTTSDDVELFTKLDTKPTSTPGSRHDHDAIDTLLERGERLRFGVSSTDDALGLAMKYVQGSAATIAIAENTAIDDLEHCDLAIELGNDGPLEPLGDTESRFDSVHRTRGTDGDGAGSRPKAGGSSGSGGRSRLRTVAMAAGAVGLVAVLLVGGIVGAAVLGIGPAAGVMDDVLADGESDDTESSDPTLAMSLETDAEYPLYEDGFVDDVDANTSDGTPMITGETSLDRVLIAVVDDDGQVVATRSSIVSGTIRTGLDDLTAGETEFRIAVGDDSDAEAWMRDDDWADREDWDAVTEWAEFADTVAVSLSDPADEGDEANDTGGSDDEDGTDGE